MVANLVVHPVVGQGERGGRLLAGAVEVEVVVCHPVPRTVLVLFVEGDIDVDAAGVVVSHQVERLGHRLRRGVELEGHVVVLAPSHVLADAGGNLQAVVGADLEVLDGQLHRVVAGIDERGVHPSGDAVPEHVVLGVLAVLVREVVVVVVVGLAVVVPVVVPALVTVTQPSPTSLVVGAVVPVHLVVHPVVGQGERRGRLLAWSVEGEP